MGSQVPREQQEDACTIIAYPIKKKKKCVFLEEI
jgi:hypothetical protein